MNGTPAKPHDPLPGNPKVSRQALGDLHAAAYGWALSRADFDQAEAQDILQNVYVLILEGKASFRGESALKTWLFALIQNVARSRRRRLRNRARAWLAVAQPAPAAPPHGEPHRAASDAQVTTRVQTALDALPTRQRDIVELVYYRDLSVAQAARVLGVSRGSASQHFARAKQALSGHLDDLLDDD